MWPRLMLSWNVCLMLTDYVTVTKLCTVPKRYFFHDMHEWKCSDLSDFFQAATQVNAQLNDTEMAIVA